MPTGRLLLIDSRTRAVAVIGSLAPSNIRADEPPATGTGCSGVISTDAHPIDNLSFCSLSISLVCVNPINDIPTDIIETIDFKFSMVDILVLKFYILEYKFSRLSMGCRVDLNNSVRDS